jgi:tetratricopeptide (TPR) repeat protein
VVARTVERSAATPRPDITPASVGRARGVEPGVLRRRLKGDLDAVVLKALRKEPEERYRTVEAFVDDLQRYLGGFPVRARSGAWAYRARRFVWRNWLGVGAAATLVATLGGAAVLLSIEQRATARERDRATREATNAGLVIDFLADVFRGRDPTQAPSDTLTARELLAWGTERVDAELGGRPDVHAELLAVLGEAHSNMGLTDEAIVLHERSTRLRRELYGDTSVEVAEALDMLARAHAQNRDFGAAHPLREEALAIERAVGGPASEGAGRALRRLAQTNRDLGRLDEAEAQLREASAIHARTASADSSELVRDMLALAYVLRARDELDEAEALYEEAIPRYRATVGPFDAGLATYLNNLAYLHRVRGDFAGAEPLYREALEIVNEVFGRGHPTSLMFANNLASALHELGRADEVVALMRARVAAASEQWPGGHWRVGAAHQALGNVLLRLGRAAEAAAPLEAAVASYTETLGASHDWTADALALRAVGHILTGREAEGRALLDRFHAGMQARARESADGLDSASLDRLEPLIRVLDDTGLTDEADRFRALLPAKATPP